MPGFIGNRKVSDNCSNFHNMSIGLKMGFILLYYSCYSIQVIQSYIWTLAGFPCWSSYVTLVTRQKLLLCVKVSAISRDVCVPWKFNLPSWHRFTGSMFTSVTWMASYTVWCPNLITWLGCSYLSYLYAGLAWAKHQRPGSTILTKASVKCVQAAGNWERSHLATSWLGAST